MSHMQIHFELFVRRKVNEPWSLEIATEDRAKALEVAEELFAERRVAAVKVTKEALDPDTREFSSVTLMAKGAVASKAPKKGPDANVTPLCITPQDLYSIHARERIGRLLEGWLRRKSVTPFELLHRPDLVEQLDATGVEIQHALQKIAVPEAPARGMTTHELIRTFRALVDRSIERLIRDGRRNAFPKVDASSFAAAAEGLSDEPERLYLLSGGVAAFMADATSWGAKVGKILDLAERSPQAGRARGLAFTVLEQPLSEIVSLRGGLTDLIGPGLDLGSTLAAMTRIAADDDVDLVVAYDPTLIHLMPHLTGEAARLAQWLQRDAFQSVRTNLLRHVLNELTGPRRLRPGDAEGEIQILRALAMALTASTPKLLPQEDVQGAFIERSKALVGSDFVGSYMEGRGTAVAEVEALIRLAENVAGGVNKRAAARWIIATVGALRFEKELRSSDQSPVSRLGALASLQKAVRQARLTEEDLELCLAKIGEIGGQVEADAKLIHTIARSESPPVARLVLLLRLAMGEAGPTGPVADRAKTEAIKLLRAPDVRAAIAAQPNIIQTVKSLMASAGLAA